MNIFRICACSYDVDLEKIIHILYVNHDGKENAARREDLTEILKFCSRPLYNNNMKFARFKPLLIECNQTTAEIGRVVIMFFSERIFSTFQRPFMTSSQSEQDVKRSQ